MKTNFEEQFVLTPDEMLEALIYGIYTIDDGKVDNIKADYCGFWYGVMVQKHVDYDEFGKTFFVRKSEYLKAVGKK